VSSVATTTRPLVTRLSSKSVVDVAITGFALAGSLALLHRGIGPVQPGHSELDPVSGVLAACSSVALIAWRRAPRAVFVLTAGACVTQAGLGYPVLPLGPTIALYLLAASHEETEPWSRTSMLMVATLFVAYLAATALGEGGFPGAALLHTGLAWAVAWFAGERTRLRREQMAELQERVWRADHEAERERRLALAEERATIARDLHDSAGHAINVIAVRAGAARMRHDQDPERSKAAFAAIEDVARQTAADIDQIVGTLRDGRAENHDIAAPPKLASLQTLIAHHAAGGLDVTVASTGPPRHLGTAVDMAAYRILQEALTNAARHGAGTAHVEIAFGDTALRLTITNPVPATSEPRASGGHGLIGMRERATQLGGTLDTYRRNGTFRLCAHLPYADPLA
jgi:signal transduction histidine kinase